MSARRGGRLSIRLFCLGIRSSDGQGVGGAGRPRVTRVGAARRGRRVGDDVHVARACRAERSRALRRRVGPACSDRGGHEPSGRGLAGLEALELQRRRGKALVLTQKAGGNASERQCLYLQLAGGAALPPGTVVDHVLLLVPAVELDGRRHPLDVVDLGLLLRRRRRLRLRLLLERGDLALGLGRVRREGGLELTEPALLLELGRRPLVPPQLQCRT